MFARIRTGEEEEEEEEEGCNSLSHTHNVARKKSHTKVTWIEK